MNNRNNPFFYLSIVLLAALGGCVTPPETARVEDTRLDQLVSNMDKSLANQAVVNAQLKEQQRQLALQQQGLESLSQDVEKALKTSAVSSCPAVVPCPKLPASSSRPVIGGLEQVWLSDLELDLAARIDTGAAISSLDARKIELFERDGKRWVRFEVPNPETTKPVQMERRLQRTVAVNHSGGAEAQRRPVVKLGIVIGKLEQTAEFTLSDRSHSSYQVLIGRNILRDVMVVDVGKKNVAPYAIAKSTSANAGAAK